MVSQQVTHSCGHTVGETVEPFELSLIIDPISVDRMCWRCLGEPRRPHVYYYGDYRMVFNFEPDGPSDGVASGAGAAPNETAPSTYDRIDPSSTAPGTSSGTNPLLRSPALEQLFVPVFDSRDLPAHSTGSGYTPAEELDTDGGRPPNSNRTLRRRSRNNNNRSAYIIDGILHHHNSHGSSSVAVPDFHSPSPADPTHPLPGNEEARDVESLHHANTNTNTSTNPTNLSTEGRDTTQDNGSPSRSLSSSTLAKVSQEEEDPRSGRGPTPSTDPAATREPSAPPPRSPPRQQQTHYVPFPSPSHLEGSEIEFSGLSIRPEDEPTTGNKNRNQKMNRR